VTARTLPTAPVAAAGLIAGYAVAATSGSRPLGGVVLLGAGLWCAREWHRRDGARIAAQLTGTGLLAFALSHVLALGIGAWPSVLLVSGATAAVCWRRSDARWLRRERASRPPSAPALGEPGGLAG
jgi:hypothetical protein